MQSVADLESGQIGTGSAFEKWNSGFTQIENAGFTTIHPDGTLLFIEGEPARGLYLVLDGTAKVSVSSPQGRVLIIRVARAGDLLGINSTVTGLPYEATAETSKQCRTVFIPRNAFITLHRQDERIREIVLHSLNRYVSALIEATRRLMLAETAAEKLAGLLLKWCDDFGELDARRVCVRHDFTQEEVAQMIGASRETVTRLLGEFTKRGLICMTSFNLQILDRPGLEDIASNGKP